ncbi:MAG: hypothetical protein R3C32_06395 [Chloroflexota bacterium]
MGRPGHQFDLPDGLAAALYVPTGRGVHGRRMCAALPDVVPLRDAVHNVGAAATIVAAFATAPSRCVGPWRTGCIEPYRATAGTEPPGPSQPPGLRVPALGVGAGPRSSRSPMTGVGGRVGAAGMSAVKQRARPAGAGGPGAAVKRRCP